MRRRIEVTLLLMMTCLLCMISVGCGSAQSKKVAEKNIKIGISVYSQYDMFLAEMMEAVEKYAHELEDDYGITVTLDIQSAGGNQITQNDQMDYFIDRKCDIVCINLVDRTDASTIIERGKSAGIPIIFFNRELVKMDLERWDQLYYVGADAFQSGIMQGEVLIEELEQDFDSIDYNGDGVLQYVMLEGEAGHQDSIVRSMYVMDTVTGAGYEVEKLAHEIANWNRDQAKTKMAQWLDEYPTQIEVVFSNNDSMALGAMDALREAGYYDQSGADIKHIPVILGIDGIKEALTAVHDGYLLGTVVNDADGQAEAMLELAYSLVFEKELDPKFTLIDGKYIRLPYRKFRN